MEASFVAKLKSREYGVTSAATAGVKVKVNPEKVINAGASVAVPATLTLSIYGLQ